MRLLRLLSMQVIGLIATVGIAGAWSAAPALAQMPALSLQIASEPTNLPRGAEGRLFIRVVNLGDAPAEGATAPIVIADKLPAGVTAKAISGPGCELATLRCEYRGTVVPYETIQMEITVEALQGAPATVLDEASVSGGGARTTATRRPLTVSEVPAAFGVEALQLVATNENGSIDTQAGSHPFQLTTTIEANDSIVPARAVKDLHFDLPAGLIGNPEVIPRCTSQEFDELGPSDINGCPPETAIGVAHAYFDSAAEGAGTLGLVPLFNLTPGVGEPAKFGFSILHVPVILDTAVRTGGDYGVVVSVNNISQVFPFIGSQVTFWGVPQDPRHNSVRGWSCLKDTVEPAFAEFFPPCVAPVNPKVTPFLTLPTACNGPAGMRTTVQADSWQEQGVFKESEYTPEEGTGEPLGLDGCDRLSFDPSISVAPDGSAASTPTGLTVGLHVGQAGVLTPSGLAPSDVKNTTVTLPEGVQISPAGADGLLSCSQEQVALEVDSVPTCPEASKVGTVEIKTPLLPQALKARRIWRRRPQTRSGAWWRCASSRKTRPRAWSSSSRGRSASTRSRARSSRRSKTRRRCPSKN